MTLHDSGTASDSRHLLNSSTLLLTSRFLGVGATFAVTAIISNAPEISDIQFGRYATRVEYALLVAVFLGAGMPTAYIQSRGAGLSSTPSLFITTVIAYLGFGLVGIFAGIVLGNTNVVLFAFIVLLWLIQNIASARALSSGAVLFYSFQLAVIPISLLVVVASAYAMDELTGDRLLLIYAVALACGVSLSVGLTARRATPISVAKPSWSALTSGLSFGSRIAAINLLGLLLYVGDLALVEKLGSDVDLADYVIAGLITKIVWMGTDAVGAALFPRITAQRDRSVSVTILALRLVTAINVLAIAVFALVGRFAVPLMFGESRSGSFGPTMLLLLGTAGISFYKLLSRYFAVFENWSPIFVALVSAIVLNLILNLALIPAYGGMGAAFASLISYFVCGAFLWVRFEQSRRVKKDTNDLPGTKGASSKPLP